MINYAFIKETDSDLVNESSHIIGYRVKEVFLSEDLNDKFQITIVLDSEEFFRIWVLEDPDPVIEELAGLVVTGTAEGTDEYTLVISSNDRSFVVKEVYEYAFWDEFYGCIFGERPCEWLEYFNSVLNGFSLTRTDPVHRNSGMTIEMIDKDGVVRDVTIEEYDYSLR